MVAERTTSPQMLIRPIDGFGHYFLARDTEISPSPLQEEKSLVVHMPLLEETREVMLTNKL